MSENVMGAAGLIYVMGFSVQLFFGFIAAMEDSGNAKKLFLTAPIWPIVYLKYCWKVI